MMIVFEVNFYTSQKNRNFILFYFFAITFSPLEFTFFNFIYVLLAMKT